MITMRKNRQGQASIEVMLLLPLFMLLAAGFLCVGYMCWQGIKVQQAANLAARIQGQERVAGGTSSGSIDNDNGINQGFGDKAPMEPSKNQLVSLSGFGKNQPPTTSVYGRYYKEVQDMFNKGEQEKLYIPEPKTGINTDRVRVVRILQPPKIFGLQLDPIVFDATAYGGEDSRMYGLPRWGRTANGNGQFYTGQIKE